MVLIGGKVLKDFLSSCLRFDLERNEWEEMPSLEFERAGTSCCMLDGHLYTFSGYNATGMLGAIERL